MAGAAPIAPAVAESASAGAPAPSATYVPELDGVRGVAVLSIVLLHYVHNLLPADASGVLGALRTALRLSWTGVDLFFVLSGFLIGGIVLDRVRSATFFRTFYVRRVLRIVPLYAVVVAGLFAARAASDLLVGPAWERLLAKPYPLCVYLTFTQNVQVALKADFSGPWTAVTWSLALEEQLYLLLPFLAWLLPPRWRAPAFVVLVVVGPLSRLAAVARWGLAGIAVAYAMLPCRLDGFFLGVCAALLVRSDAAWCVAVRRGASHPATVAAGLLAALPFFVWSPLAVPWAAVVGYTVFALAATAIVLSPVVRPLGWPAALLRLAPLRHLGRLAYGIYLLHPIVLGVVFATTVGRVPSLASPADAGLVALAAVATWLLCLASFHAFERPLTRWGHRFRYAPASADTGETRS